MLPSERRPVPLRDEGRARAGTLGAPVGLVGKDLRPRRCGLVPVMLFVMGLGLYLVIAPPLLTVLNVPYDAPAGKFIYKLHPGTYLLLAATIVAYLSQANPLRTLIEVINEARPLAFYLLTMIVLTVYQVARFGTANSAFLLDTLMMPALSVLFLQLTDARVRRSVFIMITLFVAFNAILGIGESILHKRIVPYTVAGGVLLKEDAFRSTALMGHPLVNALITGFWLVLSTALPWPAIFRVGLLGVLALGLLAFGGRTSLSVTVIILVGWAAALGCRRLVRGEFSYTQIMGGLVSLFVGLGGLVGAVMATGVGERIFTHLKWDSSAAVRVHVWNALTYMDHAEIVFGVPIQQIQNITYQLGLQYPLQTIENFWLLMLMGLGAVGFVWFLAGLVAAGRFFWSRSTGPGKMAIVVFALAASSNNSLCSKTCSMVILFVGLACAPAFALPRVLRVAAARSGASARPLRRELLV